MPEIVNVDQAKAWDGAEGDSWVEREEHQDLALVAHTEQLLMAAAVDAGEHVLDVGCGCGQITRACARLAPDGDALGLDLSTAMLAHAPGSVPRKRGCTTSPSSTPTRRFTRSTLTGSTSSSAGSAPCSSATRWPRSGTSARGMAPDGRLALMVWQELRRNEWLTAVRQALAVGRTLPEPPIGAPGPFGLADPDAALDPGDRRLRERLVRRHRGPVPLGCRRGRRVRLRRATSDRCAGCSKDSMPTTRRERSTNCAATVDAHDTGDGVFFGSAAWIIHAVRAP